MVFISYQLEKEKTMEPGHHLVFIDGVRTVQFSNETSECLVIDFSGEGTKISKKFKLWDTEFKERVKAQHKFLLLCTALGLKGGLLDEATNEVSFDASVLKGKEIGIVVKKFTSDKGQDITYIESYYPALHIKKDKEPGKPFIDDGVPF